MWLETASEAMKKLIEYNTAILTKKGETLITYADNQHTKLMLT
jgi:molecular chaperone DnaK (HSP70)